MPTLPSDYEALYFSTEITDLDVKKLAQAVLLQALKDVLVPSKPYMRERERWRLDAQEWFLSEVSRPGSFSWVCEILELHPYPLLRWLQPDGKGRRRGLSHAHRARHARLHRSRVAQSLAWGTAAQVSPSGRG